MSVNGCFKCNVEGWSKRGQSEGCANEFLLIFLIKNLLDNVTFFNAFLVLGHEITFQTLLRSKYLSEVKCCFLMNQSWRKIVGFFFSRRHVKRNHHRVFA